MNNQQKYFNKFKRDLEFIFDKLEDVDFESDRISIKTKSKNRSLQELYNRLKANFFYKLIISYYKKFIFKLKKTNLITSFSKNSIKNSSIMQLEDYFNFLALDDIRVKGTRIGIETIFYDFIHRK
jgi:hypothetical protein